MDQRRLDELDARISEHLAGGDLHAAVTVALRGHGPQLLGYLMNLVRDDQLAQEAFAQLCEELWKSLPGFAGRSRFRTWAYRLAWRTANRVRSDTFRRRARPFKSAELSQLVAEVRSATALHLKTETKRGMSELRASLDPQDQTLLFLRVDQGLSWKEVAEVMADEDHPVGEAGLRKRFERLKTMLRDEARARGLL